MEHHLFKVQLAIEGGWAAFSNYSIPELLNSFLSKPRNAIEEGFLPYSRQLDLVFCNLCGKRPCKSWRRRSGSRLIRSLLRIFPEREQTALAKRKDLKDGKATEYRGFSHRGIK